MLLLTDWIHCDRHPRCFKRPLYDARSVRIVVASPVLVDTVLVVDHTAALAVGSGHAAHLPDRSLASSDLADILAHTFDKGSAYMALVASAAYSES